MKFNVNDYMDKAIDLLKNLISYKTTCEKYNPNSDEPFGSENKKALDFILEYAKKDGFSVYNCDNYAGHIEYGEGEESLGILCHLDVVPTTDQKWNYPPFELTIDENKIYGRGTADDKGPLVSVYIAMKILKDLGFKPNKKIKLIMGCDEESGSRCLKHYFELNDKPQYGFSPDADYPLVYGEKANMHYNITGKLDEQEIITEFDSGNRYNMVPSKATMKLKKDFKNEYLNYLSKHNYKGEIIEDEYIAYGVGCHAMVPENGLNASFILFDFLNEVYPSSLSSFFVEYLTFDPSGKKLGYDLKTIEMGNLTSNVGIVKITNNNVLIGVDCRIPSKTHKDKMIECISYATKKYNLTYEVLSYGGYHYVLPDGPLVKTLMKSYQKITNDLESKPKVIGGGTYAKFIDNCVAFGPQHIKREDVCHIADEYIFIEDFINNILIYLDAIYELTK